MKRFWTQVATTADGAILLDGRPVRTPGRLPLVIPVPALAKAVADEWRQVGDTIDPRAMPITGLANAAIERIAPDPAAFAVQLGGYAASDLTCYRADDPPPLVERQAAAWDPVLDWARHRYDVHFHIATGVMPVAQAPATLAALHHAVTAVGPWSLAPLSPIVSLTGSLLLGLALYEGAIDADAAWAAAHVDEDWQAELWGHDPLAEAARNARADEFAAATRFLDTVRAAGLP